MKPATLFSILLILTSVALQSCGGKSDQGSSSEQGRVTSSTPNIETELKQAKARISSVESENRELHASNQMLTDKLKEVQDAAEEEVNSQASGKTPQARSGQAGDQSRIALMGAKALLEFKTEQLSRRVESLTAELSQKEDDLKAALENLEIASRQDELLKKKLEATTSEADQKESELEQTIKKLESTLAERSAIVTRIEGELNEKEGLLNTLKKAWSDATQLKSNAESDLAQLKANVTDCRNQVDQLRSALEQERGQSGRLAAELESYRKEFSSCQAQSEQLRVQANSYLKQIQDLQTTNADLARKQQEAQPASKMPEKPAPIIEKLLQGVGVEN